MFKELLDKQLKSLLLLMIAACMVCLLAGCGAETLETPTTEVTPEEPQAAPAGSVLIDPDTLNEWIAAGRLNNDGADEIVILDVNNAVTDHIEGAQMWLTSGLAMTRTEGPADAFTSVLDAASMNAILDSFGIDADTTIVLTSGGSRPFYPSRAYFTLRYWGFPKERIKVLDGYNVAWEDAGYSLTSDVTAAQASTGYTVTELAGYNGDLRMSLTEMISAVTATGGVALDMRGDDRSVRSNSFAGRIRGDRYLPYVSLYENAAAVTDPLTSEVVVPQDLRFLPADELEAVFADAGVDNSRKIYTYCTSGYIATTGFLALDGVLGWDVAVYDGSWNQWGKMSDYADVTGGSLPSDSIWRTDTAETMDIIIYREDTGAGLSNMDASVAFEDGNQIEDADYDAVYPVMP